MSQGKLELRPVQGPPGRPLARQSWARCSVVVSVWLFVIFHPVAAQEVATRPWPVKILRRLLVPFRTNPLSQISVRPCGLGLATCFASPSAEPKRIDYEPRLAVEDSYRAVTLQLRADFRGPLAHHWLELDSPEGTLTAGFGPATLPFIDSGQVSLQDRYGNIKRISGMHPLPWLALPPVNYHYARTPGEGRIAGKPIQLTMAQSEALTRKLQHIKFVGPYIPIFHDCRTFTCALTASAQGRSALPCYLLFKGYW